MLRAVTGYERERAPGKMENSTGTRLNSAAYARASEFQRYAQTPTPFFHKHCDPLRFWMQKVYIFILVTHHFK